MYKLNTIEKETLWEGTLKNNVEQNWFVVSCTTHDILKVRKVLDKELQNTICSSNCHILVLNFTINSKVFFG